MNQSIYTDTVRQLTDGLLEPGAVQEINLSSLLSGSEIAEDYPWFPQVPLKLNSFTADHELGRYSFSGSLTLQETLQVEVELDLSTGFWFEMSAGSPEGETISLQSMLPPQLISRWVGQLPQTLIQGLLETGLRNFNLQIEDRLTRRFSFYLDGNLLGLDGKVYLGLIYILDEPNFIFQITTDGTPIPLDQALAKVLGPLPLTLGSYLPRLDFGLEKLSFNQLDGVFQFSGMLGNDQNQVKAMLEAQFQGPALSHLHLGIGTTTGNPITLANILSGFPAWNQLENGLPAPLKSALEASGLYSLALTLDPQNEYLGFEAEVQLFGQVQAGLELEIGWGADPFFRLEAGAEGHPLGFAHLMQTFGLPDAGSLQPYLPQLQLLLTGFLIDSREARVQAEAEFLAPGENSTPGSLSLNIDLNEGLRAGFSLLTAEGQPLRISHLLPPGFNQQIEGLLPARLAEKMLSSGLEQAEISLDTLAARLNLFLKGEVMGYQGSVLLNVLNQGSNQGILFSIKAANPEESLPEMMENLLGLPVRDILPADVLDYFNRLRFGLDEITFDSFQQMFVLAGRVRLGENPPVNHRLQLNWGEGGIRSLHLSGETEEGTPPSIGEIFREIIPLPQVEIPLIQPVIDKLAATRIPSLSLGVDLQTELFELDSNVILFDELDCDLHLKVWRDERLEMLLSAEVQAGGCTLKGLPALVGIDLSGQEWYGSLPDTLWFQPGTFELNTAEKHLLLTGSLHKGEAPEAWGDGFEISLEITLEEGLQVKLESHQSPGEPIAVRDVIGKWATQKAESVTLPGTLVSTLLDTRLMVLDMELDTAARSLSFHPVCDLVINGKTHTLGLNLLAGQGLVLDFSTRSAPEALLTVGEVAGLFLGNNLLLPALPAGTNTRKNIGTLLLESGLESLDAHLDTPAQAASLAAQGQFMGLKGSLDLNLTYGGESPTVYFRYRGEAENNLRSLPGIMEDILGWAPGETLQGFLPRMRFAFSELTFDQPNHTLRLLGLLAPGPENTGTDYRLTSGLEMTWAEALQFRFELRATQGSFTWGALARDLPLAGLSLDQTLPGPLLRAMDSSGITHILAELDLTNQQMSLEGSMTLFGRLQAEAQLQYGPASGLQLQASIPQNDLTLQEVLTDLFQDTTLAIPASFPMPNLRLEQLDLQLDTAAQTFHLASRSGLSLPIPLAGEDLDSTLGLDLNWNGQSRTYAAKLSGELTFRGIRFLAELELAKESQFVARLESLHLHHAIAAFLPAGTTVPESIPDLELKELVLTVNSSQELSIKARVENLKVNFPLGDASLEIESIDFDFKKNASGISCDLAVSGKGQLTQDIRCENFAFGFHYAPGGWTISGQTSLEIFGKPLQFGAKYEDQQGVRSLTLSTALGSSAESLPIIPGFAGFSIRNMEFFVRKQQSGSEWRFKAEGVDLKLGNQEQPFFALKEGGLELFSEAGRKGFIFHPGDFSLYPLQPFTGLSPEMSQLGHLFEIKPGSLSVIRDTQWTIRGEVSLYLGEQLKEVLPEAYKLFGKVFPEPASGRRKLTGEVVVSSNGIEFALHNNNGIEVPDLFSLIRKMTHGGEKINLPLPDLGPSYFLLEKISIQIQKEIRVKATLGIGLPSHLNDLLFSGPGLEAFKGIVKTYDENDKANPANLTRGSITIGTDGIGGSLDDLPFDLSRLASLSAQYQARLQKGLYQETRDNRQYYCIDLDELLDHKDEAGNIQSPAYGKINLEIPTLKIDLKSGSFKASAGFEIDQERGISIPLKPFKSLAYLIIDKIRAGARPGSKGLGKEALEKVIPDAIPVRSIEFVKTVDGKSTFVTRELEKFMQTLHPGFRLPREVEWAFDRADDLVNRLPTGFLDYLAIRLPRDLHFDLDITPDGGVNFNLEARQEPLQWISFAPSPVLPLQFIGMRLSQFGFGTLLGGTLLRTDVSVEWDVYDLPALAASLFTPEALRSQLPNNPRDFTRNGKVEKMLTVIFYEAGIPIPIPLFYDNIGMKYVGLEGMVAEFKVGLPMPGINFGNGLKLLGEVQSFFTQKDRSLQLSQYPMAGDPRGEKSRSLLALRYNVGPMYVQFPKFLAQERRLDSEGAPVYDQPVTLGLRDTLTFDAQDLAFLLVNSLKATILNREVGLPYAPDYTGAAKPPLNYLIEYLPPALRIGTKQMRILNILEMDAAWAFTTPGEFQEVVYPRLLEAYTREFPGRQPTASPANELMELFAARDEGAEINRQETGLVQFFRGGVNLANGLLLEAAIGVMISGTSGFRTGLSFRGAVNSLVDLRLLGFLKIDPRSQQEVLRVYGKSSLKVFNRSVLDGLFDLSIRKPASDSYFRLGGRIDLFPEGFPLQVRGQIAGELSKQRFLIEGAVGFALGALKGSAYLYMRSGAAQPVLNADNLLLPITTEQRNSLFHDGDAVFFLAAQLMGSSLLIEFKNQAPSPHKQSYQARVRFAAANLIRLASEVVLDLDGERGLELSGLAQLEVGPPSFPLVRLEANLKAVIDAKEGVLGVQAGLSPNTFLFSPNCRPTGGFAFYNWFDGPHAGDFVLSAGGYHPRFNRPRHYPEVPRLGMQWEIDPRTYIKGEAYFALTPACAMAGGLLEVSWKADRLRAWFSAEANFLMAWKPFLFDAEAKINVGVEYLLPVINKTIGIQVGADLRLWGDAHSFGGRARVNWTVISFDLHFGTGAPQSLVPVGWTEFLRDYLLEAGQQAEKAICQVRISEGQQGMADPGGIIPVNPDELMIRVESMIPAKSVEIPTQESLPLSLNQEIGIAPMGKDQSAWNLSRYRISVKKGEQAVEGEFGFEPVYRNLPAALWGQNLKPDLNAPAMVQDTLVGFELKPLARPESASTVAVPAAELLEGNGTRGVFQWQSGDLPAGESQSAEDLIAAFGGEGTSPVAILQFFTDRSPSTQA
ncbi:MAG: hypothetical protein H6581_14810 [Bacteroidia bacterium]|nr:hypothetical protein [Bacteroidia bacterium]